MTLVEHSRRVMRGRTGPIPEEFAARKDALLANPEVPFVQGLRNYTLHRALPFLGHKLSWKRLNTDDAEFESEVQLSVAQLLEWDEWAPAARSFLERKGRAVALRPIIKRHGEIVVELNAWLLVALAQANVDDLAEVNEIVTERNALLGRMRVEDARNVTAETTMRRETPRATAWSAARPAPAEGTDVEGVCRVPGHRQRYEGEAITFIDQSKVPVARVALFAPDTIRLHPVKPPDLS